ncbi:Succinyl-diaminopimelate desuccinylase [bacterium HR40]|nr:Succinyl-diaminopimelate desuccinylase [bacterium HR40]
MEVVDPVELTRALVRCPSVTPVEAGVFAPLEQRLEAMGFSSRRLAFRSTAGGQSVPNLFARLGTDAPVLLFCGHTDVVPPGDPAAWTVDPFAGEIRDGRLYGRGAADMKSGIAAFLAAVSRFLRDRGAPRGSIVLFLTNDEEGPAIDGTQALLRWFRDNGGRFDAAIVGEPTSEAIVGDTIKIGRRGSLSGHLTVFGRQGHVAYPQRADNAAHGMVQLLARLIGEPIDGGSAHFEPSTLQVTTIDVGNPAGNVIPGRATAVFNVRYNDLHDAASLEALLRARLDSCGVRYDLRVHCGAEPFLTLPGRLTDLVGDAVFAVQKLRPRLSTSGGTSDARFLAPAGPVVECGIVGPTMHQVDEHVRIADIEALTAIYRALLDRFFDRWQC